MNFLGIKWVAVTPENGQQQLILLVVFVLVVVLVSRLLRGMISLVLRRAAQASATIPSMAHEPSTGRSRAIGSRSVQRRQLVAGVIDPSLMEASLRVCAGPVTFLSIPTRRSDRDRQRGREQERRVTGLWKR